MYKNDVLEVESVASDNQVGLPSHCQFSGKFSVS